MTPYNDNKDTKSKTTTLRLLMITLLSFQMIVSSVYCHQSPNNNNNASVLDETFATSHLNVDGASAKMSLKDFDQFLGNYIVDHEQFALVLDFDGTLSELTSHPDLSTMTPEMRQALENIANSGRVFVTVISGRSVDSVKEKIGIDSIIYSGNHGLEVLYPDGTRHIQGISKELADNFVKMVDDLNEKLAHSGAWVEDKKVSLTFHYRAVAPDLIPDMQAKAKQIIESYGYRANQAHCAVEGKPPINWNKGLAAEYILKSRFDSDWESRKVIFAGDDTTDEDVMKAIKGFGRSFRISRDENVETHADFRIPSVQSVYHMLKWIENKILS